MTEPDPETEVAHPWLDLPDVLRWLQLEDETWAEDVEPCRVAAAAYCERQRPDLMVNGVFTAEGDIVMAGVLAAARLWARRGTPAGLASYGEFGVRAVLRLDPDVNRLLGTPRPAVG